MMKTIKKYLCLLHIITMLFTLIACEQSTYSGNKGEEKITAKMSENFVSAESVKDDGFDNYQILQGLLDEGNSIYLPQGKFYVSKPLKLKNAQIEGSGFSATTLYTDSDSPIIEADGQFRVSDMTLYNSAVTGKEKEGEKVIICLGQNGGVTEGSIIRNLCFKTCGTAIYEAEDATPSQGLTVDTIEYTNISFRGVDFQSNGRKNIRFLNNYMGRIGNNITDFAEYGLRFTGKDENLRIDQLNLEHFRANTPLYIADSENFEITSRLLKALDVRVKLPLLEQTFV